MLLFGDRHAKYTFSGHDSFQCRQFWLKKGYDFVKQGSSFSTESAVVKLGVGKNMVAAIRYWLRAFAITDAYDQITPFGAGLLNDDGYDPFLEDDGSLWLLHASLVQSGVASIYSIIFNEYRREKIEFDRESYLAFMRRKSETDGAINYNAKTLGEDYGVFRKMYLAVNDDGANDEGFSGLLSDLGLVRKIEKRIEDKKVEFLAIENDSRASLPLDIFLYVLLNNPHRGTSISLNSIEHDYDSPGTVFAMTRAGIIDKLNEAQEKYKWITYSDHAGVKQVQLNNEPEPVTLLNNYYGQD